MLPVQSVHVDVNNLQKALGNIRGREPAAHVRERIQTVELALPLREHRIIHDALGEIGLAEEVMVADRNRAHLVVRLHILHIRFDDRIIAANSGHLVMLARNHTVNRLIHGRDRTSGCVAGLWTSLIGCLRS